MIDGFKSKLEHYRMFKEEKWEEWVEDVYELLWELGIFKIGSNISSQPFYSRA
jgi:hypothetical protein